MKTGIVEANLVTLNEQFNLPYIAELIVQKTTTNEKMELRDVDIEFHKNEFERLCKVLEAASAASRLPETPSAAEALNDLLKRVRMRTVRD